MKPDICPIGEIPEAPYFFEASDTPLNTTSDPFETSGWLSHCETYAESLLKEKRNWLDMSQWAKFFLYGHFQMQRHLFPLKRFIEQLLDEKGTISIVDIGGGFGDNYFLLSHVLGKKMSRVSYTVVDNNLSCELGFSLFPDINFSKDLPNKYFDLSIVVGTLQYIPEWKDFMYLLISNSESIYIARSPIRKNGETFYMKQAICPAFGESAQHKVGTAALTVIAKSDIFQIFLQHNWVLKHCSTHSNYEKQLARLPKNYRNVAYYNIAWSKGI